VSEQPLPTRRPGQPLEALARLDQQAWLVGGAVRDRLLGHPTGDYDVVVGGDARAAARLLAHQAGGHPFELSEAFAAWRVVARDRSWQVDLVPLGPGGIEADLAQRDLTINAIAQPLPDGALIDPHGGADDLRAGVLRAVSEDAFERDPLRVLRLVRLACELSFAVEPETAAQAKAQSPRLREVAPERVFAELKRIVGVDRAIDGLAMMDALAATAAVLPELVALRGVEQSRYHHLDVHDHTLAVLGEVIKIELDPSVLGEHAEAADEFLQAPLANELTRWQALRFGALLHDIGKPQTKDVTAEGRVTFMRHDALGADIAASVLTRLRASDRLREHVAALARHHLRLGFLVHEMPLSRRAVYGYLETCGPVGVDVTVLSVADRLATRGDRSDDAIAKHLELAGQMLGEALTWASEPPRPPLRGDELVSELGLAPGPEIGRILAELQQAAFSGEISSRDEALERARALLRR
jgi:poly(A) polymerase